jgi:hypothetical protein
MSPGPKARMGPTESVGLRLPVGLHDRVKTAAFHLRQTVSEFVAKALQAALRRPKRRPK